MTAKQRLREDLLERRTHLDDAAVVAAEQQLCDAALMVVRDHGAARVAAYLSMGREPPTWALVEALCAAGVDVLVPRSLPRRRIVWVADQGRDRLVLGRFALPEPSAPADPGGLRNVQLALVPALAVDRAGFRLGRGGGYYDTALAEAPVPLRVALAYDHEIVDDVHPEPHDERVDVVVTPARTVRLPPRPPVAG